MRIKDEQKQEAIIRATLELTHEKGLAGIKMSALAERAKIATGSLYTYFADKQDLLLSVNRHVREMGAGYLLRTVDPELSLPLRLRETVGHYADFVGRNRESIVFVDQLKRSPYMTDAAYSETIEQYRFLQNLIVEGQQAGFVRAEDPEKLLHVMDGIIKALVDFQLLKGSAYGAEVREQCQEMVWGAVRE